MEPGDNQGTWDEGWNCRDHALIAGVVCQLLKLTASVVYGEATFVQGPDGVNPPVGLCQSSHAWLGIDGLGYMDLSPNLLRCRSEAWRPWPLQCIALNKCVPSGTFAHSTSQGDYGFRVNAASNSSGCNAIYFGRGVDPIDSDFVENCFEIINSPMTVRLSANFDATIYPRAAIHLFKLVKGESQSLTHLTQDDAWETISRQPGNPLSWLKMRGGIR
jgi:hypothetical protein